MMIRRVVGLFLVVQMLLNQGLLCHCSTATDCQERHGGETVPHIHISPSPFSPVKNKPRRCRCCCSRPGQAAAARQSAATPASEHLTQGSQSDGHDDAVYLPQTW